MKPIDSRKLFPAVIQLQPAPPSAAAQSRPASPEAPTLWSVLPGSRKQVSWNVSQGLKACQELMQRTAHMAKLGRGLLNIAAFLAPPPVWSKEAKNAEEEEKKNLIVLHSRLATLEADNSGFKTLIEQIAQDLKYVNGGGQQPTARESQMLMMEMDKHYTEAGKRYLELHELTWTVSEQQQTNRDWLSLGEFVDVFNAPEQWANLKELYHEVKSALTHLSQELDQSIHDHKAPWEVDEGYLPAAPALYRTETVMQKLVLALYAQGSLGVTCNNGVYASNSSSANTQGALARYEQADKAQDQRQESELSDRMERARRFHKAPESDVQASTGAVDAYATWREQVLALAPLAFELTTTTPAGVDVKVPETQLEILAEDGSVFVDTASVEMLSEYPGKVMMPHTDLSTSPLPKPGNSGALTDKETSSASGMRGVEPAEGVMARMDAVVSKGFNLVVPWDSANADTVVPSFRQNITMTPLISINDQQSVKNEVVKLAEKFKSMYQPIMDPADFIRNFIREGISEFESSTKIATNLKPESKIKVTFIHHSRRIMAVPENEKKSLEFALVEVVTGVYLHEASRVLGAGYTDYILEHSELISELKKTDLQSLMQDALAEYKNNHEAVGQLKHYYADMINVRCLEYLSHPHVKAEHIQAVEKFQSGGLQAQEVEFHGAKLNGVFFIPSGISSGLLFSVDDPKYFHIGSKRHTFREMGKLKTEVVPTFPSSTEFKSWVLAKIPYYYKLERINKKDAFEYTLVPPGGEFGFLNNNKIITKPFSFKSIAEHSNLVDQLFYGFMGRLTSDIDTLVYTRAEKITDQMLNAVKGILNLLAATVSLAIPGTGTILGKLSLAGTSLLAGGTSAGVSGLQAHLSERPEQTKALMQEAIVGGLMTGLFGIPIGTATGKYVLKEVYSLRNIRQALDLYRHVRKTVSDLHRLSGITASGGPRALPAPMAVNLAGQRPPENLIGLQNIKSGGRKPLSSITAESISQHRIRYSKGRLASRIDQRPPENLGNVPTVRLEPLRQLATGKVGNLAPEMRGSYDLLKLNPTIKDAIDVPAGKCEALLRPVAERIQDSDIGMKNIQYRAMQLWNSASEQMPTHHFVVVGEKGGKQYVFDLSAHQFADRGMPDLNGPLILTEADWAQKYAGASSRKLIKYKDFNNPLSATTEFHAYPGHSPKDVIEGGTLLTDPQWYKRLTNRIAT